MKSVIWLLLRLGVVTAHADEASIKKVNDYFRKNPNVPYCAAVIRPKLEKLQPKLAKP